MTENANRSSPKITNKILVDHPNGNRIIAYSLNYEQTSSNSSSKGTNIFLAVSILE